MLSNNILTITNVLLYCIYNVCKTQIFTCFSITLKHGWEDTIITNEDMTTQTINILEFTE